MVEHTSKLRAAPREINYPALPACPCSTSHRKLPGRDIADAWDNPLICVGTMSARGSREDTKSIPYIVQLERKGSWTADDFIGLCK